MKELKYSELSEDRPTKNDKDYDYYSDIQLLVGKINEIARVLTHLGY